MDLLLSTEGKYEPIRKEIIAVLALYFEDSSLVEFAKRNLDAKLAIQYFMLMKMYRSRTKEEFESSARSYYEKGRVYRDNYYKLESRIVKTKLAKSVF